MRRLVERVPGWAAAVLTLLGCALLHCAPVLFAGDGSVLSGGENDLASQFLAWREFGFGELAKGNLALWNPRSFCGSPFLGAFESALLYPPNWLHLALPLPAALNLTLAFHLFLGGLLTCLWCSLRGRTWLASTLAGLLFMFSGPTLLRLYAGHLPIVCAAAWAPGILLCLDAFAAKARPGWLFLGALAAGMQLLAGNPQIAYYTAIAAFLMTAGSAASRRDLKPLAGFAAVYAAGAGLAAVQLLPGLATAAESVRGGGLPLEVAGTFSLPFENLATLAVPWLLGDIHRFPYFGRWYLWETCLFIGAGGLTLALAGLFHEDRRSWLGPGLLALAMLVLALGARLPVYGALYHALPGWDHVRGTAKFSFLLTLFLSMLAAAGFDKLKSSRPGRWPAVTAFALALGLMAAAGALGRSAELRGEGRWAGWLRGVQASGESLMPAGKLDHPVFARHSGAFAAKELFNAAWVLVAVSGLLYAASSSAGAVHVLALLTVLELGAFSWLGRARMSTALQYPERWKTALQADPGDYRVLHDWSAHPNAAMRLGLLDVMGYSQLSLKRHAEFIAAAQGADPSLAGRQAPITRFPKAFAMLRLKYDLADPLAPPRKLAGSMERLAIVRTYRVIPDKASRLAALMDPGFDPKAEVILESLPVPKPGRPAKSGAADHAEVLRSSTDRLDVSVRLAEPGLLLVTDNYSKGWRVSALESGQKSFTVLPADHTLMAVPLGAGGHLLRFEYRPRSFVLGAWLSLASLALFCGLAAAFLRRSEPA